MPLNRLTKYLDEHGKKYIVVKHSPAFTAQEVAASAHIPGKEMVKSVMVKVDGDIKMIVLPSTHDVDFELIKEAFNAGKIELAKEDEFEGLFPDCEVGAMPPFGNFYEVDTLVAEALTNGKTIAFNAGTHKEVVKMSYSDYEELVQPRVLPIGVKHV